MTTTIKIIKAAHRRVLSRTPMQIAVVIKTLADIPAAVSFVMDALGIDKRKHQ
jgi:hypothetical protein